MRTQLFTMDSYMRPDEAFHFARISLKDTPPAYQHTHDFYEVVLVESGTVRHWINGVEERLPRGSLIFIRPDDCHRLAAVRGSTSRLVNIVCRPLSVEHLGSRYGGEFGQRFFWSEERMPDTRYLEGPRIERAVNSAMDLDTADRRLARIEQFLLSLITRVVDITVDPTSSAPDWLAAACLAARDPRVFRQGAAGLVEVSRRGHEHVCRVAKRHLGMSPTDYVNRIRMEHAAMLLADGRRSVEDIAEDCGIGNLSYFYRLFRAHYGATPREYRRRHSANPASG